MWRGIFCQEVFPRFIEMLRVSFLDQIGQLVIYRRLIHVLDRYEASMHLKQLAIKFNSLKMSTWITHFFQFRHLFMRNNLLLR
jgi:hypothetical protein